MARNGSREQFVLTVDKFGSTTGSNEAASIAKTQTTHEYSRAGMTRALKPRWPGHGQRIGANDGEEFRGEAM